MGVFHCIHISLVLGLTCWMTSVRAESSAGFAPSVSFAYPPTPSTGLTINRFDIIEVEWQSNFDETWLYLWCDEYKPEDDGQKVIYNWYQARVSPSGSQEYTPWDMLENDPNNRTGRYPYPCYFQLYYNQKDGGGIIGPRISIASMQGQVDTTTYHDSTTQVQHKSRKSSSVTSLSSDISVLSTTTTISEPIHQASSSSPSTLSTSTSTRFSLPTDIVQRTSTETTLSPLAKAGISVGAVLGILAITGFGLLFHRNYCKLKDLGARLQLQKHTFRPKIQGVKANTTNRCDLPPTELEDHGRHELPARPARFSRWSTWI